MHKPVVLTEGDNVCNFSHRKSLIRIGHKED